MTDGAEIVRLGRTNLTVTRLGVGGTPLGNLFREEEDGRLASALERAWASGLRYFDTAPQYGSGLSERRLGNMLAKKPRDSFVLSTKVGKLLVPSSSGRPPAGIFANGLPFDIAYDYSFDGTLRSISESLDRLGLSRIDIVLIHDVNRKYHGESGVWQRFAEARDGACRALRRLREEGVIGAYGSATKDLDVNLRYLAETDIDCIMQPARYTLLDRSAGEELFPRCVEKGVSVLIAGAFDSGILATGPVAGATYDYQPAPADVLVRAGRMEAACASHGVPLAAAALQFPLSHPAVASVVTGVRSAAEVDANLALMRTPIPDELRRTLATL